MGRQGGPMVAGMVCPHCGSRAVGRVGTDQYYCWECCIEWNVTPSGNRLFWVDEEGELEQIGSAYPGEEGE